MKNKKRVVVLTHVAQAPTPVHTLQCTDAEVKDLLAAFDRSANLTAGSSLDMNASPLHLTHISVGNAIHDPTVEELQGVLERFIGPEPFCESHSVKVREHEFNAFQKVVLTMGTKKWVPTDDELKSVRDSLALVLKEGGVLVTHYSAKLTFLSGPSFMSATVKATQ